MGFALQILRWSRGKTKACEYSESVYVSICSVAGTSSIKIESHYQLISHRRGN